MNINSINDPINDPINDHINDPINAFYAINKIIFLYIMSFFVYLLISTKGASYVGATIDLDRRLRQHNKEIKGGARATAVRVNGGETWTRAAHVEGFPDWTAALQFEWRWKQLSRKLPSNLLPLERRMLALKQLLALEKPTTAAVLFSEWETPPLVVVESDDVHQYYP